MYPDMVQLIPAKRISPSLGRTPPLMFYHPHIHLHCNPSADRTLGFAQETTSGCRAKRLSSARARASGLGYRAPDPTTPT